MKRKQLRTLSILFAAVLAACAGEPPITDDSVDEDPVVDTEDDESEVSFRTIELGETRCVTMTDYGPVSLVDVDGGDPIGLGGETTGYSPTFAMTDEFIAWCQPDETIAVFEIASRKTEIHDISCMSLSSSSSGEIFFQPGFGSASPERGFDVFPSLPALLRGEKPTANYQALQLTAGPISLSDTVAVTAWHSDDKVSVLSRESQEISEVALQRHNGWFGGISVVGDVLYLLTPGWSEDDQTQELIAYDLLSGRIQATKVLDKPFGEDGARFGHGLACFQGKAI